MTSRASRSKSSERILLSEYRAKRRFGVTPEPSGSKRIRPSGAAGSYGGGEVIVWDWGTYDIEGKDAARAIEGGRIKIRLHGQKLNGSFTLVKMKGRKGLKGNEWLLFKDNDNAADSRWTIDAHGKSVKTGETIEAVRENATALEGRGHAKGAAPSKRRSQEPSKRARPEKKGPIPRVTNPELATLIDAPFDDDAWFFEIKWDGFRAIATIDADHGVHLASRNGKDLLARFPTLASIGAAFDGVPVVVDGEIVALDDEGKSSFQRLQNGPGTNLSYVVFDLLYAEGRDLRGEPLEARKEILGRIVKTKAKSVVVSRHIVGKGKELFATASAQGLEGIVAKRRDSKYLEKRTHEWVKVKAQLEQECVVVGYTEPAGARSGFGSLILGLYEGRKLVFCGHVGTGFDEKTLASLSKKMKALKTKSTPFPNPPKLKTRAHWIAPKLVAQIRFTEWTNAGSMRHPTFLGLRDDKKPAEVHREKPRATSDVA